MKGSDLPIGVFDSGIGGLTVVRAIASILPSENIVYLGDTARVPYGIRSPETVIRYALEGTKFLLSRGIKLMVVACNTVSAVGLDKVRNDAPVPVIGVIVPGAKAAALATKKKKVGVIGTEATIRSKAYLKEIRAMDDTIEVFSKPCPLFVPLVEEGWLDGDVPSLAAERYLKEMKLNMIDTLVLGCTHYPLLKPIISDVMGSGISLIDSATETASDVKNELQASGMLNGGGIASGMEFYVTDSPDKFKTVGERFLGTPIEKITRAELEVQ